MALRAALFDFDGTLVDTTELIYQSMRHATGEILGKDLPREILLANVGQPLPRQMELIDAERAAPLLRTDGPQELPRPRRGRRPLRHHGGYDGAQTGSRTALKGIGVPRQYLS